jgi:hypothetical protein
MPWTRIRDADGRVHEVHVRMSGRPKVCAYCGFLSSKLCDARLASGLTCDRPLCDEHAFHAGTDVDYCREHAHHAIGAAQPLFEGLP